jgi:cysteine-rich repeat protein
MGRTRSALFFLLVGLTGCSVIVDGELSNKDGSDAGPTGPRCDNTQQCLMISDRVFDCTQECIGNVCVTALATPDGTFCGGGTGQICVRQTCEMRRCGDGFVERQGMPPEYCDDGNENDGDLCNNMCTRSCVPPAPPNCDDGDVCNGEETCGAALGVCRPGARAGDGTPCMVAATPGTCQAGVCVVE